MMLVSECRIATMFAMFSATGTSVVRGVLNAKMRRCNGFGSVGVVGGSSILGGCSCTRRGCGRGWMLRTNRPWLSLC